MDTTPETTTLSGSSETKRLFQVKRAARKKGVQFTGPDGAGVIVLDEIMKDLKTVTGVPDIENHPRGILFFWAVEHAPACTLQKIADSTNALTDEQAEILYNLTVSYKNCGVNDWKTGWRNALYYGLANAPGA